MQRQGRRRVRRLPAVWRCVGGAPGRACLSRRCRAPGLTTVRPGRSRAQRARALRRRLCAGGVGGRRGRAPGEASRRARRTSLAPARLGRACGGRGRRGGRSRGRRRGASRRPARARWPGTSRDRLHAAVRETRRGGEATQAAQTEACSGRQVMQAEAERDGPDTGVRAAASESASVSSWFPSTSRSSSPGPAEQSTGRAEKRRPSGSRGSGAVSAVERAPGPQQCPVVRRAQDPQPELRLDVRRVLGQLLLHALEGAAPSSNARICDTRSSFSAMPTGTDDRPRADAQRVRPGRRVVLRERA